MAEIKNPVETKGGEVPRLHVERGDCCGCSACYAVCPVGAISMQPNEEGFLYPVIDETKCIRCQRCIGVCAFKKRLQRSETSAADVPKGGEKTKPMNVMFLGQTEGNTGPANANRSLVTHWPKEDKVRYADNKKKRLTMCLTSMKWADVCVITGYTRVSVIASRLCAKMGKPLVCVCHGYAPYERTVNRIPCSEEERRAQDQLLRSCTLLSGVSQLQAEFLKKCFPDMVDKIRWHNNGVEYISPREHVPQGHPVIAVTGGTRPIKNNDLVVRAVGLLAQKGMPVELRVYGRDYAGEGEKWVNNLPPYAKYMGQVTHEEFLDQLTEVDLLVMASIHEPFGLSGVEGLQNGTSLLLSEHCGVSGILDLTSDDVIPDGASDEDVAQTIENLLEHPNGIRLLSSIDYETASWESSARKFRETCAEATRMATK